MMSNSQAQSVKPTIPQNRPTGATQTSRASVPISVYRELASELQATEAQLNALKAQNQKLLEQNQRLRQKAIQLFVSAQQFQQLASTANEYGEPLTAPSHPEATEQFLPPQPFSAPSDPQNWVAEIEEKPSRRPRQSQSSSEVSAWVLGTAVGLIVLTALGLGFLAMRVVMNSNRNS
ncbi:MAG: hypothetical protein SVX43_02410 [Cyanobacteriota bacterium]|nr:hypothetical protein [Cyanobacteriota bacterium]